jgi:serine protease inhibitor
MQNRRTLIPACVNSLGSEPISLKDKASADICRYNTVVAANNTICFHVIISVASQNTAFPHESPLELMLCP